MQKQNKPRTAAAPTGWVLLLSYLISLLLVVLAALLTLYSTLCSGSYMQGRVRASGFAATAYTAMVEDFTSYGSATGFSANAMTAVLSQNQIEVDINETIERMYDGNLAFNTRAEIGEAAYKAMEGEALARGTELTDEVRQGVEIVAEAVRQEYAGYTAVPLVSQLYTIVQKVEKIAWVGVAVCAVLAVVAVTTMLRMARSDPRLGARSLVFALGGAALVCLVLGNAIFPVLHLENLNFEPLATKNLIVSYVQGMFGRFNLFAAIYFVLSLLLAELLGLRKKPAPRQAPLTD